MGARRRARPAHVATRSPHRARAGDDRAWVPAAVGGEVFEDYEGDGLDNHLDRPVEWVTVNLHEAGSTQIVDSVITLVDGLYLFTNLCPGDYQVEFVMPHGYSILPWSDVGTNDWIDSDVDATTGYALASGPISLSAAETNRTVDVGMPQLSMHSCREVMGIADCKFGKVSVRFW